LLSGLIALVLFPSCELPTDWHFQSPDAGALVVEAIITDERKIQEVQLSLSYDDLNGEALPAAGAQVRVSGDGEIFDFAEDPVNPGRYVSEEEFSARLKIKYTLEIQWNGAAYEAENSMVQVIPFQKMTFKQYGNTDSLVVGEVASLYSPHEQAMYRVDIDWRHLAGTDSARARMYFYTFNTVDVSEIFRPAKETVVFPKGSIVIERKYGLNPEFAAYLRALVMETEWQGGAFDEASSSPPTNISNGGHGFFGVCAVLSDTLIAEE